MAEMSAIRTALANKIGTISGLRTAATVPDQVSPPIAVIIPERVTYDEAYARGLVVYTFIVQVVVGKVSERSAQNRLDGFVNPSGATSIKAAIEADKSLGGVVFDSRVTEMTSYTVVQIGDIAYLSCEFRVTVLAD
jgi:hypothetical protein